MRCCPPTRSAPLGTLVNHVQRSDQLAPWTFGVRALFDNLGRRGLLETEQ
jgi:fumarylacetoacetate (FAA) hydrolase family protein